ncbi:MAG: hypothetical protein M0C28_40265 [Candidatus Moduliflexus flocculans]|nr:hypothetical protein [Candidatus Moduliflexus flocculans]
MITRKRQPVAVIVPFEEWTRREEASAQDGLAAAAGRSPITMPRSMPWSRRSTPPARKPKTGKSRSGSSAHVSFRHRRHEPVVRADPPRRLIDRLGEGPRALQYTSSINAAEVYYGAARTGRRDAIIRAFEDLGALATDRAAVRPRERARLRPPQSRAREPRGCRAANPTCASLPSPSNTA